MVDLLLSKLADEALACYDDVPNFAWEGENKTSHLRHSVIEGVHTFTFAGTMPTVSEWLLDLFAIPISIPDYPGVGNIHAGFSIGALGAIHGYILPTLKHLSYPPFRLCGHSKGAGQAGQAHGILKCLGHKPLATRLFEPPMFGGKDLSNLVSDDDIEWTQTYNKYGSDLVTHIPFGSFWYRDRKPIRLQVPDSDTIAAKHRMPSVMTAIGKLLVEQPLS